MLLYLPDKEYYFCHGERHLQYKEMFNPRRFQVNKMSDQSLVNQ